MTFAQARTIVQAAIADSSNSTFVDQCIDQAQREVARARRWPELMVRAFVNTVAAYQTGTIAVANAGTTWTLTGGTFPTDVATGGYRIALSVNDPWCTIVTRTDGTHVETAAYQGTTQTASAYVAYKSHYSLASTVDRVEEVWLHDSGRAVQLENATNDARLTDWSHHPTGVGTPTRFYSMERDSSNNRQVLLGPDTPDAIYRMEFVTRKKTTDGTLSLDDSRWPVILARALSLAYAPEFYDRSQVEWAKYLTLLAQEWGNENEVETQAVMLGQGRLDYPQREDFLSRGTVVFP